MVVPLKHVISFTFYKDQDCLKNTKIRVIGINNHKKEGVFKNW